MSKIRRFTLVNGLLMIMMLVVGCNQSTKLLGYENFFTNFKNYEAQVKVWWMKDTMPHEAKMKQTATLYAGYELILQEPRHLAGVKITSDGKEITQYDPATEQTVHCKVSSQRNEILLTSFVERYLTCKTVKKGEEQLQGKNMITFEIPMEEGNKYMVKEKIWLDYEKRVPVLLAIFDEEGKVTLQCEYENFKYNF